MSGIFERLVGCLLGVFNFFENLRVRRGDDAFTKEYKRLQKGCVASVVVLLALLVGSAAAVHFVEALEGLSTVRLTLTSAREILVYLFAGGFLLAMLYAGYSWTSLLLFVRKHGAP